MPKQCPPADALPLLDELRRIDSCLERAGTAQGCAQPLCIARHAPGLDAATWLRLQREHGLEHWAALPALPPWPGRPDKAGQPDPGGLEREQERSLRSRLAMEIDRSRQCAAPLALALVQADTPGSPAGHLLPMLAEQVRSFDFVAQLDSERVAVVLCGTALAQAERTLAGMLRRLRQALPAQDGAPGLCSAGVVGYGGSVALEPAELLDRAGQTLALARERGGNRLEVAAPLDVVAAPRHTLVGSREKHFLFTGKRMPEK